MKLNEVVPWGRTLDEYRRMFNLTDADLVKRILGAGDGPASFNAQMTDLGHSVVSVDPMYAFSTEQLEKRIRHTYETVIDQLHKNTEHYNWATFHTADELGRERMKAMNQFLNDYETGREQDRYQVNSLPVLPYPDQSFDLALCSHLLFLYSDQLSETFHQESIHELSRVAREVRIFPLISLHGKPSPYLASVLEDCYAFGVQAEIIPVDYHFQKGANQMLRLTRIP